MARRIEFTKEQRKEIRLKFSKAKKLKDIKSYKHVYVLNMRRLGKTRVEISEATGYHPQTVSDIVSLYVEKGMDSVIGNHYTSHNRRMSVEEEAAFLEQFRAEAESGLLISVKKILAVACQHIRQYKTVYGAVEPESGDAFYQVYKGSNKENMSCFLRALSQRFPDHIILLVLDNASWHMTQSENSKRRSKNKTAKSKFKTPERLIIPDNIRLTYVPPRTPEMNPIEIIWREIRSRGFKNILFDSLQAVVDKFYEVVENISNDEVISITRWPWIDNILDNILCEVL